MEDTMKAILDVCSKYSNKEVDGTLEQRFARKMIEMGLRDDAKEIMKEIAPLLPEPMRSIVCKMYGF